MTLRWSSLAGTRLIDDLAGLNLARDWPPFHRALADRSS